MVLAQLPAYVVGFPPVALPVGSAKVDLPSLRPIAPALEVGANAAVCLTGAAELGVDVAGPSLPVRPRVSTMVVFFWSGFKLFQSLYICSVRVTLWCKHKSCLHPANFGVTAPLSQRCSARLKHTANHWYSLVSVQKNPGRAPTNAAVVSWYPSLLLRGGAHSVHVAEAMLRPILLQSILDEPPEILIHLWCYCFFRTHRLSRLRIGKGRGRSLWTGLVLSGLPQSSMPACTPQFSLLLEPSTAVFWVHCRTVVCGRLVGHVCCSIYPLSGSPQQRPCVSISAGPFSAARNHNPTRTASIFICVDSYIQALTAKHRILTPSPVARSQHNSQFWTRPQQLAVWLALPPGVAI